MSFTPLEQRMIGKAIKKASQRLPFASERKQNEMLEHACGSLAEAYRIGAEEAQGEIIRRLRSMLPPPPLETGEQYWVCSVCNLKNDAPNTHCMQCEYSRMVTRDGKLVPRTGRS